jgi:hypothetical protein
VEQPRAEPTEDLIRILDAHEHSSEGSVLDYFLSPVTLGLYPFLVNEKRLIRHAERNREALGDDEDARLKRYRAEALDDVQKGAKRRMEFGIVLLPILLALASAGAWAISEVILGTRAASEELGAALILGSLVVWIFSQLGLLASHWGAVRRHESKQLYLGLLARGTSEDEARRLLAEHQAVWRKQGGIFAGITAVLCFPTPAAFLLPFWLARAWRQPLDVHKDREANVPELFPRRVGKKGSPTPADPEAEEDLGPVG